MLKEKRDWKVNKEPITHVDATPDEEYPLRILRAYRSNCDCKFVSNTTGSEEELNPLLKMMNEDNAQRAEILDRAIAKLSKKKK